jgi:phenylpyruvate tautomerase PptA (4-oxalocrotonate tautomerase family)
MPILRVEVVAAVLPAGLAQRIADGAASALGTAPGRTWVRLRCLAPEDYAENGADSEGLAPVFVELLLRRPLTEGRATLSALTDAVAEACERPRDRVHILLLPPAAGRMSFGGVLA